MRGSGGSGHGEGQDVEGQQCPYILTKIKRQINKNKNSSGFF